MKPRDIILALPACALTLPVFAADSPPTPYAGQQARPIKALSDEDIAALRKGEGMGMAKVSELNGYLAHDCGRRVQPDSDGAAFVDVSALAAACHRENAARTPAAMRQPFRIAARFEPRALGAAGARRRGQISDLDRRQPAPAGGL